MKEKKISEEELEGLKELYQNEEFQRMWIKMHTPIRKNFIDVGRNEICPFCDSGKKFKKCECYELYQKNLHARQ